MGLFLAHSNIFELAMACYWLFHKAVQYRRQMKETEVIDFGNLLLHSTLIYLVIDTLPLYEFSEFEILL